VGNINYVKGGYYVVAVIYNYFFAYLAGGFSHQVDENSMFLVA
jgi:hypothetical protein